MEFAYLTYQGPPVDDFATLEKLPSALRGLLEQLNGFVQFGGGLHLRGACSAPTWHSLGEVWSGKLALWKLYPEVLENDVPFGQDAVGDQFLLRGDVVHCLAGETGEVRSLFCDLTTFLTEAQADPERVLGLAPLLQFHEEGGELEPGQLLSVYPPFCMAQAADGVSLRAVPVEDRIRFLADFAKQIAGLGDGTSISIEGAQT
ncbi:hypothetical protein EON80_14285 [bacterium]|nr:MAG: hypothetical protein EON80_14285 [bacterium]